MTQENQNTTTPDQMTAEELAAGLASAENMQEETQHEGTQNENTTPTIEELQAKLEAESAERQRLADIEKNQRLMIERQSNELGDLRKKAYTPMTDEQKRQAAERAAAGDFSVFDEVEARAKESALAENTITVLQDESNKRAILNAIPNFEELTSDIANLATQLGNKYEEIEYFKQNPWRTDPTIAIQMANKVLSEKRLAQLELEAKQLREDPKAVLDRIQAAAKTSPTIKPSTTPAAQTHTPVEVTQITQMTDEQLRAAIKEAEAQS